MIVKRIDRGKFELNFSSNETLDLERFAGSDNKPPNKFIEWLLRVGLEIYRLTVK